MASLKLELVDLASWLASGLRGYAGPYSTSGITGAHNIIQLFYVSAGDLNSGTHAWMGQALHKVSSPASDDLDFKVNICCCFQGKWGGSTLC